MTGDGHVHRWREVMWCPSGRGRPADPRPHLVCDGGDDCPVINDVERSANVGDPIDLLFEDDPR